MPSNGTNSKVAILDSQCKYDIIINGTSRVPVQGKSSVCAICMKYRIIILIIISLGQILLSYTGCIANISRTHARTPTPPPFRLSCSMGPNQWPGRSTLNVLNYKYKYSPPQKYLSTSTFLFGEMYLSTFRVLSKCT